MRLARPAVIPRVEKSKQTPLLAVGAPRPQASIRRLQIILLQDVCLLLVRLGREDEVARDDGEFVEHQEVRWRLRGDVDDVEVRRRVGEGVEVFFGCWRGGFEFREGFLCERGAVPELELCGWC